MKNVITKENALLIYSHLGMRHVVVRTVEEAYWNYNMQIPVEGLTFTYIDIYSGEVKTEFINRKDKEDFIKDKIIILEVDTDIFNVEEEYILPDYIKEAIYDVDMDESFTFNYEHRRDIVLEANELDLDNFYIDYGIYETLKTHKFYIKEFYDELKRLNMM